MNLPNKLTVARICMIPLFVAAYLLPFVWAPWVAVGIFLLAAFTDFLDGFIARKYNLVTDLGKLLDPIADKVLVMAALVCLVATNPFDAVSQVVASGFGANFPWTAVGGIVLLVGTIVILARELIIDAVRMLAASKGVVVQANIFGKIKTVLLDVSMPLLVILKVFYFTAEKLAAVSFRAPNDAVIAPILAVASLVLFGVSVVMALVSGIIYLVQNRQVFATAKQE